MTFWEVYSPVRNKNQGDPMKSFANTSLAASVLLLTLAAPAMASTRFQCPSKGRMLALWNQAVTKAHDVDHSDSSSVASAQLEAFDRIWNSNVPNHNARSNQLTFEGKNYDIVVIAGTFTSNPDYLDSYGVIFEQGQSEAIAAIKTDTDRSDYSCKAFEFVDRIVLPAAEFDVIAIDSPQDVPVVVNGVRYEHFYAISTHAAIATNPHGDTISFIRAN